MSTTRNESIDIGGLIDAGTWGTPQNVMLGLACFTVLVSMLIFGLFTAALATAHGIAGLTVLRFLAGTGLGGAIPNVTALVAECSPVRHRALAVTLTAISMTVGGVVGAGIASWILPAFGWRVLFLVAGCLPLVALPVQYRLLPESPKYLAGNPLNRQRLLRVLDRLKVIYPTERPITRKQEGSIERGRIRSAPKQSRPVHLQLWRNTGCNHGRADRAAVEFPGRHLFLPRRGGCRAI